jgi:hypothetical protein
MALAAAVAFVVGAEPIAARVCAIGGTMGDVLSHDRIVLPATTATPGQLSRFIGIEASPASYYRPGRIEQIASMATERPLFV